MHSFPHIHWSDIKEILTVEIGFDLVPEIGLILDNAGDDQAASAQASNLDGQMNAFIRVNPAEENQVITAGFLKRLEREIDAVVDGRQVIQTLRLDRSH